jgi:adenosylmethionine-8-amino-7-oxononanoate aminotransferase
MDKFHRLLLLWRLPLRRGTLAEVSRVLHRAVFDQPDVAIRGEGLILTMADGREIMDASGGAAVACLGHGNRRVAEAIGIQALTLAYAHTGFFSTEPAEALAEFLLRDEPGGLSHAFFVSSGSEAMESALKLARQYFIESGEPQRTHFIARHQSYHGNTLGALTTGGNAARRAPYEPLFASVFSHVSPCFAFHYQGAAESDAQYVARLAQELDEEFQRLGPDTVVAFCAEPVVGATAGCVTAVPGYFRAIRDVCNRYGALLILDEVMCGMGRTGTTHAWEQEGVTPDIQAIGKGLGGGYQAIAGILVSRRVIEALASGSGAFVHGHTYQAHPVACAAALEVQRVIRDEGLLRNVGAMGSLLERLLRERLGSHQNVGDIRGRGLFFAVEFLADRDTKTPFDPAWQFHTRIRDHALNVGLAIYPSAGTIDGKRGDHLIVAPPYNSRAQDIETIVDRLETAIEAALKELRGEMRVGTAGRARAAPANS